MAEKNAPEERGCHIPLLTPLNNQLKKFGVMVDDGLKATFGAVGLFTGKRPLLVIAGSILLTLLFALGLLRFKIQNNQEKLYTPQNSQAFTDRAFVNTIFRFPDRETVVFITDPKNSNSNILTKPALLAFLDVYNNLASFNATNAGITFNLESPRICDRPGGPGTPCDIKSVLAYWNYSAAAIEADPDIALTVSNPGTDGLGRSINRGEVMGGVVTDPAGKVVSVAAFQLKINNQNNKPKIDSSSKDDYVEAWEKGAIDVINKHSPRTVIAPYIATEYGQQYESDSAISADISLLVVGYILLAAYGLVVLAKNHPVSSASWLAVASIGSILLAVVCAFGFASAIGTEFSLVEQVLALLLLGLGTDDMLVIMASHQETADKGLSLPQRLSATMAKAGRGIIVTTSTNFVAFATGISSELPALKGFMIYAAAGVIFVFVYQTTFFAACLLLDMRRQAANRVDWLCCIQTSRGPTRGCVGTFTPGGDNISQRLIGRYLPAAILHWAGKIVVMAITVGLLVLGVAGAVQVQQNFDGDWFVPQKSYYQDVLKVQKQYFQGNVVPFGVYTKNLAQPPLDYFAHQQELEAISTELKASPYVATIPPVDSWYAAYVAWLPTSSHAAALSAAGLPRTSADFHAWLAEFLDTSGARYVRDVIFFDGNRTSVRATKVQAYFKNAPNSRYQVDAMNAARDIALSAAPTLNGIAYTDAFLFWQGYESIVWDTLRDVIIAGSVVFVIMIVLLGDLVAAIAVGAMVVCVDVELVGSLHWLGLSFNAVTAINLLLAIGIAVDYSAFIAYSFMDSHGSRDARAKKALARLGVAVFNGGFTVFLAIVCCAGAQSYIFRTFFKMFSGIVLLGLWHGLVALPVILSLIGTAPYQSLASSDYADNGVLNAPAGGKDDKAPVKEVAMQAPTVPTIVGNGLSIH
ncbi:putative Patched family protein [Klebsormidium nitens]|uniref:Putative Patched family protein n=1 Tax=Klebsormidium nitens TaxID=105231 RepID=A0A1Y1IG46_KLENI|nr:putative Patched family protein [Klebsormidium nitens]|eukprot:GAQ89032.1 putative Patched family protein [Klebsormidium nitens]